MCVCVCVSEPAVEDVWETQVYTLSGPIPLLMLATDTHSVNGIGHCSVWEHTPSSPSQNTDSQNTSCVSGVAQSSSIHTVVFVLQEKQLDSNSLKICFCADKLFLCSWTSKLVSMRLQPLSLQFRIPCSTQKSHSQTIFVHSREVLVWD